MTYAQLKADPCLYFACNGDSLVVLVSWVDGIMILGPLQMVEKVQHELETAFIFE